MGHMAESLFTWQALGTLAGAALLVYFVVQYTKALLDRLVHVPTDLYAVVVGALVLIGATAAQGEPLTWANVTLALANGFVVAATAGQVANKVKSPPGAPKEGPTASD